MKTLEKLFISILLSALPVMLTAQDKDKDKNIETVKFITSIDCNNCVNKIMSNLPLEKGIKDVKCDLPTKEVTVTYKKDKSNPGEIKKAIEKLGYTAKQVTVENTENRNR